MEQNREPRNKPTHLRTINLWQKWQEYTMGKRQPLQQVVLEKRDHYMQETQTGLFHIVYKNKLKWIKDLNVRSEAIKLLEENQTPGLESFLDLSLYSRETKVKISKWHNIKLKSFRHSKENYQQNKIWENIWMKWEKIFVNNISDKGFNIKMYKELNNSTAKNNPVKKLGRKSE